jgi:hypothetical protein
MHEIDGAHALRVVILDACRNNPFETMMKRTTGEVREVARGLALLEPTRGSGVVIGSGITAMARVARGGRIGAIFGTR